MSARKPSRTAGDRHKNEGPAGKYFHQMLNMADDDLGPFEYRLLGHYIRVCGAAENGVCFQTVRVVAAITKMSIPKVIAARNSLLENGWITVEERANKTHRITVVDRMKANVERYSVQNLEQTDESPAGDQDIERGDQNIDHGDQYPAYEEEHTKKNTEEEPKEQKTMPEPHGPGAQESTTPLRPDQALFSAICEAFGYSASAITKDKRGQINGVVTQLVAVDAAPEDMAAYKAWMDAKVSSGEWRNYTVSAMSKYWTDFVAVHHAPPPAPVHVDFGDQTQDQIQDEIVARFRAKSSIPGAFDDRLTPEERAAQDQQEAA